MDMRTDLIAVPHASLRDPNPENQVKGTRVPVVKGHEPTRRQVDGVPLTSAAQGKNIQTSKLRGSWLSLAPCKNWKIAGTFG